MRALVMAPHPAVILTPNVGAYTVYQGLVEAYMHVLDEQWDVDGDKRRISQDGLVQVCWFCSFLSTRVVCTCPLVCAKVKV